MAKGIDQRSMKHMYNNFIFQIQDEIDSKEATILAEQVVTAQGKGFFVTDVTKMLAYLDPHFPLSLAHALCTCVRKSKKYPHICVTPFMCTH